MIRRNIHLLCAVFATAAAGGELPDRSPVFALVLIAAAYVNAAMAIWGKFGEERDDA